MILITIELYLPPKNGKQKDPLMFLQSQGSMSRSKRFLASTFPAYARLRIDEEQSSRKHLGCRLDDTRRHVFKMFKDSVGQILELPWTSRMKWTMKHHESWTPPSFPCSQRWLWFSNRPYVSGAHVMLGRGRDTRGWDHGKIIQVEMQRSNNKKMSCTCICSCAVNILCRMTGLL